jgi:RimJ/RimL family protein N-acetyltransferase
MIEPVVVVGCHERRGPVVRSVYPLEFSEANLRRFWELASKHRVLFTDEINGNFQEFMKVFISIEGMNPDTLRARGLVWVIDDFVGVFYMTHITHTDAVVHYSFFDAQHSGREVLVQEMIKYVFKEYGLRRLSTEIGMYASRHVFGFVERIGFRREGRRRKSVLYKDAWFDTKLYGILREEVEEWDQKPVKLEAVKQ